ncbi:MAG: flagellar protein FliS [Candidatus Rokubacteria bacterium]|nr:flagellar protein FliS [Candidatus Rokubacteria bacterium]
MPATAESYARTAYLETHTRGMSPQQVLLQLYDIAIAGCVARDMRRASAALVELIAALDFSYEEIARGLYRLYEYALREVKAERYETPINILRELRDTWEQAFAAMPG